MYCHLSPHRAIVLCAYIAAGNKSTSVRPYLIDYMFHGFPSTNFDQGGRQKKKKKKKA